MKNEWKPIGIVDDQGRVKKKVKVRDFCPTIRSETHGNEPKVVYVKNATKDGYSEIKSGGVMDLSFPDSKTRRGRVIDGGETSPTLDTGCQVGVVQVAQIYGTEKEPNPQAGRIYSAEGGVIGCQRSCVLALPPTENKSDRTEGDSKMTERRCLP